MALHIQRVAGNRALTSLLDNRYSASTLASRGAPLHDRGQWEALLGGEDFSVVRVHADERAASSARSLGAKAYTVGADIVFGAGNYKPSESEGRRLIAHELAHVVQQRRGGQPPAGLGSPAEQAADSVAAAVGAGERVAGVAGATGVGVARQVDPRHARGFAGEQGMGFERYSMNQGWLFIEGPSGAAGHGVTTSGFDGVGYNPNLDELHLIDNKSLAAEGDVRSATAIDPSKNLRKNLNGLIERVRRDKDLPAPARKRVLELLKQTREALVAKRRLPPQVRLVVTPVGGRSTGVSGRLAKLGVEFLTESPPRTSAAAPEVEASPSKPPEKAATAGPTTPAEPAAVSRPTAADVEERGRTAAGGFWRRAFRSRIPSAIAPEAAQDAGPVLPRAGPRRMELDPRPSGGNYALLTAQTLHDLAETVHATGEHESWKETLAKGPGRSMARLAYEAVEGAKMTPGLVWRGAKAATSVVSERLTSERYTVLPWKSAWWPF